MLLIQVLDCDVIKIKAGIKLSKNARILASLIIMQRTAEIVYCSWHWKSSETNLAFGVTETAVSTSHIAMTTFVNVLRLSKPQSNFVLYKIYAFEVHSRVENAFT